MELPKLARSLTVNKIKLAEDILDKNYENVNNKKAIIEINHISSNTFFISWIEVDLDGSKILNQNIFNGNYNEIVNSFDINLTM